MKYIISLIFILLSLSSSERIQASNIQITQKPVVEREGARLKVSFPLSWEHSWRANDAQTWDAAWVFLKYRVEANPWDHLYLSDEAPLFECETALAYRFGQSDVLKANASYTPRNVGLFIYRDSDGKGHLNITKVSVYWDLSQQDYHNGKQWLPIDPAVACESISIKVFAIEMCYVAPGAFYLGSQAGGAEYGRFRKSNIDEPFQVVSELPINISNDPVMVNALSAEMTLSAGESVVGASGSLTAAFPKGFAGFYCMKYELNQLAYVEFLNTLSDHQQAARIAVSIKAAKGTKALNYDYYQPASSIVITAQNPTRFGCNYNDNTIYDEPEDGLGQALPLRISDVLAFADFSGLRPMTELEYEKACRGTQVPVMNAYAWGTTDLQWVSTANHRGTSKEAPADAGANLLYNTSLTPCPILRNGAFAGETTSKVAAGASVWGIMELSNNMGELTVNMMDPQARRYSGMHGDGRLNAWGDFLMPQVAQWTAIPTAYAIRGGSFMDAPTTNRHCVADRSRQPLTSSFSADQGARLVRTVNPTLLP